MNRPVQDGANGATLGPPALPPNLTDAELRAVAYFAIGVSSEGSIGGRDVSNRLSFAGNIRNGVMQPIGNSGLSIGTLQTDLGQHPGAVPPLVDAYQAWARTHRPDAVLSDAQRAQTIADLGRDGNAIRAQQGRPLDAGVRANLDAFLRSDDGISFVHNRDVAQVDTLMTGVMARVQQTALYRDSAPDDQVRLATIVAKVQNQSGDRWTPALLRNMDNGTHASVADVSRAVDRLLPRAADDYMETGRDHALAGAEVLIALRNADQRSPLHQTWRDVMANPLVNPTQLDNVAARPNLRAQYDTVKTLFLQPAESPALIAALDRGGTHAYGRPQAEGNLAPTAGLYAMGNDLVVWNRDGVGHANIGGTWSDFARTDVTRTRNPDRTTDLHISRDGVRTRLLHVDPAAPPLRAALTPEPDTPRHARAESPLLQQAREHVHRLDASLGRTHDHASDCMTASLACLARERGLERIDHVLLSRQTETARQGEHVFVLQGRLDDPTQLRAHMKTAVAVATPVDESLLRLDQLDRQPGQQVDARAQEETQRQARSI